jgi:hypothetical protein
MPKYVALPDPPEPVVAHHPYALYVVARMGDHLEWSELEGILPGLLKEKRPRDTQKWRDAGVTYEVRHVRVPAPHPSPKVRKRNKKAKRDKKRRKKKKKGGRGRDSRASHFIRKRESTLHGSQVEDVNRNDEVRAEFCHAFRGPRSIR